MIRVPDLQKHFPADSVFKEFTDRFLFCIMKVAIIIGSVREGRKTHHVAEYLASQMVGQGIWEVDMLDLEDHDLPVLKDRWKDQDPRDASLEEFSRRLTRAEAMIFVSPEYHGSYTGVLKNAVDHFWAEFKRKPIGVVATGSGRFGGLNASTEMQQLILSLGAYPMPRKLLVPFVRRAFDADNQPLEERLAQDVENFLEEFTWFSQALISARKPSATTDT